LGARFCAKELLLVTPTDRKVIITRRILGSLEVIIKKLFQVLIVMKRYKNLE